MRWVALLVGVALLAGCGGESSASCEVVVVDEERASDVKPLEDGGNYKIEFETTHGSFTVEIDEELAPCNGGSMMQLAENAFFDGVVFHRIVPGFVIQAGQSTKTPDGGPGYTTIDPPPADTQYRKGVVAMAKTELDPPGTGGSQFFVVTGSNVTLPPDYAPIGKVVEGMAVVAKIGKLGDLQTQTPTEEIVIEQATVSGL
ncbi:MAG TPA: peptidylprolyl isomerase [Gaiellaceae bacterium]|nr:peptidylprolyl isomerase [Gaiellaceae bacterium]